MTTPDQIRDELLTAIQDFITDHDCTDENLDAIEDALAIALAGCVSSRSLVRFSDGIEDALADGAIEGVYEAMNAIAERN